MPKRTRSHELESNSIRAFERQIPSKWVCRRKGDDYGVDLEVEVFDQNGDATGLQFFVQLKATDNPKKRQSVSMEVDRIEYLDSFDHPAMVVRYCEPTGTLYFAWVSNIIATNERPSGKKLTLKFQSDDLWTEITPQALVRTLQIKRTIKYNSHRLPLGLEVDSEKTEANSKFNLNHALSQLASSSRSIIFDHDTERCLPVKIWIAGKMLCLAVDVVASLKFVLDNVEREEIFSSVAYGLAFMSGSFKMSAQNADINRVIVEHGLTSHSRKLASSVARYGIEHPELAAEIASLNGLHERQDEPYLLYLACLLSSSNRAEIRSSAVRRFYEEAIEAQDLPSSKATLHYSLGNYFHNLMKPLDALVNYNKARKAEKSYLELDYFLCELGASLFFGRKFRAASRAYEAAHQLKPTPQIAICAGDSLLFSGAFERAKKFFEQVLEDEDEFYFYEASLKLLLCDNVQSFLQDRTITDHKLLASTSFWIQRLDYSLNLHDYDTAMPSCLMVAFLLENDSQIWTQALLISAKMQNPILLAATISCAVQMTGYEAYSAFRDELNAQEMGDALGEIDAFVDHLHKLREQRKTNGVEFRTSFFDTSVGREELPKS